MTHGADFGDSRHATIRQLLDIPQLGMSLPLPPPRWASAFAQVSAWEPYSARSVNNEFFIALENQSQELVLVKSRWEGGRAVLP